MFRRKTSTPGSQTFEELDPLSGEPVGKGRPTPSRREAEKARKQRLAPPKDRKEAARRLRQKRAEERLKMQEAMKSGEERYLPRRDQGRVRRFARDLVDARWNAAEFLLPVLVLILTLGFIPGAANIVVGLWLATILGTALDTIWLVFRTRRELKARFEPSETRGTVAYTVLRSTQLRRLRLPKPQVSRGARLPARY